MYERLFIGLLVCFIMILCLPIPRFHDPYSTLVEANDGTLLGAQIASDGQWRFASLDSLPTKFSKCLVEFEDHYFYYHPGFNPLSIGRAIIQSINSKRIVSGASTITMQVVRLSRKGKPRVLSEKFIELFLGMRFELAYSKDEILKLYATHAPFGGNVVGLEAASWRYYRCSPENLSWGESATLAVLPNAPSLIYPGKNSQLLLNKRNRLLKRLYEKGTLSELDYKQACLEPLPNKPVPLPRLAPHLVDRVLGSYPQQRIKTTISVDIQKKVLNIVEKNQHELKNNLINNIGAIVMDVETGAILAYVGNTTDKEKSSDNDVDMVRAKRSSGSILKPFLYGKMLDEGKMLPNTLLKDIPIRFSGYSPQNYALTFDGAVPAGEALSRSLNIPSLYMLKDFGISEFQIYLQSLGFTTLKKSSSHYGLSLILGGGEVNLWELCGAYGSWARILKHYNKDNRYRKSDIHMPYYKYDDLPIKQLDSLITAPSIGAGSIWWTFEAMRNLKRPMNQIGWKNFSSSTMIAWKTGTSYGFRDAWAVGINTNYVVGIWVGNSDGEGRTGINGVTSAAPVLFDIFGILGNKGWFKKPFSDLISATVCRKSGYRASPICQEVDTIDVPEADLNTKVCPYHIIIHLDKGRKFQVSSNCYNPLDIVNSSWFVLPPAMEWYYKQKHYEYKVMPPWVSGCESSKKASMQLLYPEKKTIIYVPYEVTGKKGYVVFKAVHHDPQATIYWHIDQEYVNQTVGNHQVSVQPEPGTHTLSIIDDQGNMLQQTFTVLGNPKSKQTEVM